MKYDNSYSNSQEQFLSYSGENRSRKHVSFRVIHYFFLTEEKTVYLFLTVMMDVCLGIKVLTESVKKQFDKKIEFFFNNAVIV